MISKSPYGDKFKYSIDFKREAKRIDDFIDNRKTVVVQGLGFIGTATVAALSNVKDEKQKPLYNVIGVDLADERNYWKIARANRGRPPISSPDKNISRAYQQAHKNKHLMATYSEYAYSKAAIVMVDIGLDADKKSINNPCKYAVTYDSFKKSIKAIADGILEDTLVVIETTVPPGTTEMVIYPIFKEAFKQRKMDIDKLYLVYSYERAMPGPNHLDSVINFYRVYSGINEESKRRGKEFFESFISTKDYPLYETHSVTASEMAKVLENSFRAANIAFIQEWTEYAQKANINLFEVIDAIRMRPTHKNIMQPGFGVGGYCLPKDPLLADWSFENLFGGNGHLKMSVEAVRINDLMPRYTFKLLKNEVGNLKNKRITILGVSYLSDLADTRHSPVEYFYDMCLKEGAVINLHDPLVNFWEQKNIKINTDINYLKRRAHDACVFAVRHSAYLSLTAYDILSLLRGVKVIIDANNIISDNIAKELSKRDIKIIGVGKGHWSILDGADE